jgi:DNA segregation ATPase FtsK/SpoIIIE-like protein
MGRLVWRPITREENGDTLLTGPVVDQAALHGLLKKVRDLGMLLSEARQRDIKSYNQWAGTNNKETLPTIVLIIDELADLMMTTPDDIEPLICFAASPKKHEP